MQGLPDIGVQLEPERTWPETSLEPLGDDTRRQQCVTLMGRLSGRAHCRSRHRRFRVVRRAFRRAFRRASRFSLSARSLTSAAS